MFQKWGVLRNTGFPPGWVSGRSLQTPSLRGFEGLRPEPFSVPSSLHFLSTPPKWLRFVISSVERVGWDPIC